MTDRYTTLRTQAKNKSVFFYDVSIKHPKASSSVSVWLTKDCIFVHCLKVKNFDCIVTWPTYLNTIHLQAHGTPSVKIEKGFWRTDVFCK